LTEADGNIRATFSNGSNFTRAEVIHNFEIGRWYHFVAIFDNGVAKAYIDGKLRGSGTGSNTTVSANNRTLKIGAWYHLDNPAYKTFSGQIDEVKIYNYALTLEQIKLDYNGGAVRFE